MNVKNEASVKKTIQFSLIISELQEKALKLTGLLTYSLKKGLIITTDYPLEKEYVLHFNEKIEGYQFAVVKRVVDCGKIYMAQLDYK